MSMRLIDADALWMEIIHTMDYCDDILEIIEQQKTIEPTHPNDSNTLKTLDCIGRQEAIDAVRNAKINFSIKSDINFANYRETVQEIFDKVLDAQQQALEQLPSAQTEEDCDTCKHGYFGSRQCDRCRVMYPSHYERRSES